jgi:Variant SH3 domain
MVLFLQTLNEGFNCLTQGSTNFFHSSLQKLAAGRGHQPALCIQAIAIADFKAPAESSSCSESLLSFNRGDVGELVYVSQNQWWCVRMSGIHGWVPADYWRILSDVRTDK